MELNKKVLVGTVGYHLLGNHSIGPILFNDLREQDWPIGVFIEEMNWGPIAIVQNLEAMERPYDRVVFLVAVERPSRKIGQIDIFKWKGDLPDAEQIQACIGDAATGVISIYNLLVIGEYFKIWPKEVYLLDVEPGPERAGEHLKPEIRAKVPEVLKILRRLAIEGGQPSDQLKEVNGKTVF